MESFHGGRLVAQALRRHSITHGFTLCGGHIQAIYDGCVDENIRVIDVRHAQTAGHAADVYARITGRPGVALVTAGPGATSVVTALANTLRAGSHWCAATERDRPCSAIGALFRTWTR
ncbi:MAG: thiamine pyrophosphate-binding protein [Polyangiaceae bacterium]|nr:thiamine pyrophosphate-binding protein [Polyangiaceae bacterium]